MQFLKNKIFRLILWGLSTLAFFILFIAAIEKEKENVCKGINVEIDYAKENYFVNKQDIQKIIERDTAVLLNKPIHQIALRDIENSIKRIPYVKNAELYLDMQGQLHVKIKQRNPILKVINNQGVSYYIDENGEKMPISFKFTSRVPVASGHIKDNGLNIGYADSGIVSDVYYLAKYISKHSFWEALVDQIYINEKKEIEIIPKLGNHIVLFGNIQNMEKKFRDLFTFYKEGLKYTGWYQYKTINLKYEGQIVCTKY